jgi:hypothetical protein
MYQNHSITFSGWQHYYHQRQVSGPVFMQPLEFDVDGQPTKGDDAEEWIKLWDEIKPPNKTFHISAYQRCMTQGKENKHQLWEIVQNVPVRTLEGYTFEFADGKITVSGYCTQISFLVEKLTPTDEDYEQYNLINDIMNQESSVKRETLEKENLETLKKRLEELTIEKSNEEEESKSNSGSETETDTESEEEVDEQDQENKELEKKKKELGKEIKALNDKHYARGNKQKALSNKDIKSLEACLNRMKKEVSIREKILKYDKGRRLLKQGDTKEFLSNELKELETSNTDAITAGKAFNEKNYSKYFKDRIDDFAVEGIVSYTKEEVEKLERKLEPKKEVIEEIQLIEPEAKYDSNIKVDDLKKIRTQKKEWQKATEAAKDFNSKNYDDYFTNVDKYEINKEVTYTAKSVKDRIKELDKKVKKIKTLRTYDKKNEKFSEDTDFDTKIKEAKEAKAAAEKAKAAAEKAKAAAEKAKREAEKAAAKKAREDEKARIAKEKADKAAAAKKAREDEKAAEKAKKEAEKAAAKKAREDEKARIAKEKEDEKAAAKKAREDKAATEKAKREAEKARIKEAKEAEKAAEKAKREAERNPTKDRKHVEALFDPNVDMDDRFPLGLTDTITIYTKKNLKEKTIDPILLVKDQLMVEVQIPSTNFDLVHIETSNYNATVVESYTKVNGERFFYDKKAVEVIQENGKDGEWFLQAVKPENMPKGAGVEFRGIQNAVTEPGKVGLDLNYKPRDAQNVTIRAVNEDLLISHAPGKGKTFTAILKAEKKRNELKNKGVKNLPRILVLAPNAVLLKQWQNEVTSNRLDPRNYSFQTYNLFRNTFTTGRFPKWKDLDDTSKAMIIGDNGCWRKDEDNKWYWDGDKKTEHVEKYYETEDIKKEVLEKMFWPKLNESVIENTKKRKDLLKLVFKTKQGAKARMPVYIQDTVTNKYLNAKKLFRDGQKIRLPANFTKDKNSDELNVLTTIERRTDFYQLHQEDIFLHHSPTKGDPYRYYFFTNLKLSQRINKILGKEEDKKEKKLQQWIDEQQKKNVELTYEDIRMREKEIEEEYEKKREEREAKYQQDENTAGDQDTDVVEGLDAYGGKVPFTRRQFKGEKDDGSDYGAYDPTEFLNWLKKAVDKRDMLKDKLPNDIKIAIRNDEINKFDTFQDFASMLVKYSSNQFGRIQSKIIDNFINLQHGRDLSQHRYQVDPSDSIVILDEAHDKEAITDNWNKVSTKVMLQFLQSSQLNLFVTATPMQSEKPMVQLWLFSEGLKRKEDGTRLSLEDVKKDWNQRKVDAEEKVKKEIDERKENNITLNAQQKKRLKRRRKYEEKFDVAYSIAKKISRSFEMQPTGRKLFLDSVLSDIYFHEALSMVLKLDRRMYDDPTNKFSYFDKLTIETKNAILRKIGESKFKVEEGDDFENPFPKKMHLLTPYDKGFMRSYMDEVRMNVCRYAERDANKVYYDYTTYNVPKKYASDKRFDSYAPGDAEDQHRNFNEVMSNKLFEKCKFKCIPFVINRCKAADLNKSECDVVDAKIMEKLQAEAFNYTDNDTFQPLLVPVLADSVEEAWDYLGRVLIKSYRQNVKRGVARASRTLPLLKDMSQPRGKRAVFVNFVEKCKRKMEDELDEDILDHVQKARWMHFEPDRNDIMPYIPNLMSSKYKDICELLLKKDREHVNGIVYHPNYQVHYRLGETLMAHGAKKFDASNFKFLQENTVDKFVENAKKKILKKWNAYSELDFFHHASRNEDNPEKVRRKWTPTYEIERLQQWGKATKYYQSRFHEENKSKATEKLHEIINNLGDELQQALENSDEWEEKPINVKKRRETEEGWKVVEQEKYFWFKKSKKKDMIEYIKYNSKETEFSMYLEKVYRLKEPVIRSDFGKYYALDDDDSELVLYEGRNGSDGNGPSDTYRGPIVQPASKMDYIYYVTKVLADKFTKVWTSLDSTEGDIRPSFGKTTTKKKAELMVSFSLETYDKQIDVNHDDRYEEQRKVRTFMRRAENLVINDYYTIEDGKKAVNEYEKLYSEVKNYEEEYFKKNTMDQDFNRLLNKVLFRYIYLYVLVQPANYRRKYPNRAFSQLQGLEYLDTQVTSTAEYKEKVTEDLEKLLKKLPTARDEDKNNRVQRSSETFEKEGRPRYITKKLVEFLQQEDVQEFLKVNDDVKASLKNITKPKKYEGSKKEKADILLEALKGDIFQKVDTQADRKKLFQNIETLADANFSLDIEEKVENFNKDPCLKNLLALKDSPYLKDYYSTSRTWKFTSQTMKKEKIEKSRKEMTSEELFEKVWEEKGIFILPPEDQSTIIKDYFENKYKNTRKKKWSLEELQNEAQGNNIPIKNKEKDRTQKDLKKNLIATMIENTTSVATSEEQKEITKFYFSKKMDKKAQREAYKLATGSEDTKKDTERIIEVDFDIIPELTYTWYRRNFVPYEGEPDYNTVLEDNYKKKPSYSNAREGTMYQPYQFGDKTNGGINLSENSIGLRVETVPSSEKAYITLEAMEKRHRALNENTFISFMYYNAQDTGGNQARDLVKQAHEAGLIDFLIMSGAGITGVDLQSTRQSLMVMVQPSKSPGLKDQFVGRLIRNMSHAIIPHKFQRVEHVTFFNSLRRAPDGVSFSRQAQPWPMFNDFESLREEAEQQRKLHEEDESKTNEYEKDGFVVSDDEEALAVDLDELLEENPLYATTPTSKRTRRHTQRMMESIAQEEEQKKEEEDIKKQKENWQKLKRMNLGDRRKVLALAKKIADGSATEKEKKEWEIIEEWKFYKKDWTPSSLLQEAYKNLEESESESDSDYESDNEEDLGNQTVIYENKTEEKVKEKTEEKEKRRAVGGNLDRLVDSQIDNHVNISAVITVGNHAFTSVQQYVNSDFKTTINKEYDPNKSKRAERPVKIDFGFCCYNCHYENEMDANTCKLCGIEMSNRYYKLVEYPILEQIGNTEVAWPQLPLYPLGGGSGKTKRDKDIRQTFLNRSLRYMKPDGQKLRDAWTRQEAMLWHYKTGFFAKLVERNQLRYLLSMVTVEHFFKQQKDEVKEYTYKVGSTEGSLHVRTKSDSPYGWENRLKKWYEVVYPGTDFNSVPNNGTTEQKETSDVEFEYFSEYDSEIESEYSD